MQKPDRPTRPIKPPQMADEIVSSDSIWLRLATWIFVLFVVYILVGGWLNRGETDMNAKDGTGYMLGIIGGCMLLLILLYPARKHLRGFSFIGKPVYWLRIHMLLGISGPLLILLHANFSFGSAKNSTIALICMLLVVGSGIIGRFFYRQVYNVMYDHHYSAEQILGDLKQQRGILDQRIELSPASLAALSRFEISMKKKRSFLVHFFALPYITYKSSHFATRLTASVLHQIARSEQYKQLPRKNRHKLLREYEDLIYRYCLTLRKTANLALYERLFSFWHWLHFPLYIVLIFTGVLHVIVVHMY